MRGDEALSHPEMERLVKDLLRLPPLDAGQEILNIRSCDVRSVVQSVVSELSPVFASRRQLITINVDPDARTMQADLTKLHDVIHNLVANASTYAPEDTTIEIVARARERSAAQGCLPAGCRRYRLPSSEPRLR